MDELQKIHFPQGFPTSEGRINNGSQSKKRLKSIPIKQSLYINQVYHNAGITILIQGIETQIKQPNEQWPNTSGVINNIYSNSSLPFPITFISKIRVHLEVKCKKNAPKLNKSKSSS